MNKVVLSVRVDPEIKDAIWERAGCSGGRTPSEIAEELLREQLGPDPVQREMRAAKRREFEYDGLSPAAAARAVIR